VLSDEEFAAQLSARENQIHTPPPKPTPLSSVGLSDDEFAAQLAASENQMQSSTYADAQIARLLQEKQELEERLRQAENLPKETIIDISSMDYPNTWEPQSSPFQSFDVKKGTAEWNNIENHFHSSLKIPIIRIERVQNKGLWAWFYLKKKELEAKNSSSKGANEKYAFHGSRNNAYETILKEGFDHRVANMGGALGAGIYFAHQSATSSGYVSATGPIRKMLYCRVLAGDIGPGKSGLRRPPEKTVSTFGFGKTVLYDSVGNEGGVYVVFDNNQCYPEYVIHY
jgi:poly [ADP-ribose] polymerase 7/11/12/13